ncbi:ArsI/CadI family heavy metal resistance metalloenzyme [Capilliphycus salinus ALCB114379]|uniref:ArsI/CadI family heavy metal resistance metalloenzyme n=1 Tax=Capilliphycus salinus TaxID=2768948 RepID=UPI0039A733EB
MSVFKTHVALVVRNLEQSVTFYQTLFGVEPVKYKADYAKFDVNNPPLNLTLNLAEEIQPGGTLSHLGIQVESSETVQAAIERFKQAKLTTFEEHNTDCCYAIQDKVWVTDPDGNRWEVFVVKLADTTPEENLFAKNSKITASNSVKYSCCK